jgi:hypothetical protein
VQAGRTRRYAALALPSQRVSNYPIHTASKATAIPLLEAICTYQKSSFRLLLFAQCRALLSVRLRKISTPLI